MDLGRRLAEMRGRKSQREVARAAGIDAGTLSRIERGQMDPAFGTVERIIRALRGEIEFATPPSEGESVLRLPGELVVSRSELQHLEAEVRSLRGDLQKLTQDWARFREARGTLAAIEAEEVEAGLAQVASQKRRDKRAHDGAGGRKV